MKKRILSLLLVVIMVMSMMPTAVFATAQNISTSNVTWELTNDDKTLIIGGTGAMPDDERPWEDESESITTVVINPGVTSIGDSAFYGCSELKSISIPAKVTNIGSETFFGCYGLESVTFPNDLRSIGESAFMDCRGIASIEIPGKVTSIGKEAFQYCVNLKTVTVKATTPPTLGEDAICKDNLDWIYVPYGTGEAYKSAWSAYEAKIQEKAYAVAVAPADHGIVTVSQDWFEMNSYKTANKTVNVTATPDEGYQLKSLSYKAGDNEPVDIKTGKSFTMPLANVTVTAEFEKITHDLTVTKNGSAATEGEDYEWDTTDSNKLVIKANGLTVSGTTTKEYIYVDSGVTGLTVDGLSVTADAHRAIEFKESSNACTLTLKNDNTLSTNNENTVYGQGSLTVTGEGNLSVTTGNGYTGIYANSTLTLDCSGTVIVDAASYAIRSGNTIAVTANTGKLLAYGNNGTYGAFGFGSSMTVADGLTMTGSTTYKDTEANIIGTTTIDSIIDNCVKTGGNVAKSVLIVSAPTATHDLSVTKSDGSTATEGTVDDYVCKDYYWDGDVLHIISSGLKVTGETATECIVVDEGVANITFDDFNIVPTSKTITTAIEFDGEGAKTVTLLGDNAIGNTVTYDETTIASDYKVERGIYSYGTLTITGDGDLTICDREEGIETNDGDVTFDEKFSGTLTIEDFGESPECAINAAGKVNLLGGTFKLTSYKGDGIHADDDVTINGVTKLEIYAGGEGIWADGDVTITDCDDVDIISAGESSDEAIDAYGKVSIINCPDVTLISNDDDDAIYAGSIVITNSTVDVTSEYEDGLDADSDEDGDGSLTINGGSKVTIHAADNAIECDSLIIEDAGTVVYAVGDTDTSNKGAGALILGGESAITVTGGTVKFTGEAAIILKNYETENENPFTGTLPNVSFVGNTAFDTFESMQDVNYKSEFIEEVEGEYIFEEYAYVGDNIAKSVMVGTSGDCTYAQKVNAPVDGETFGMKLGGKDAGEFTFEKNGSGWNIQNSESKYLAMKDGKLVLSDTAFAWTYKNGAFYTTVKTEQKSGGYWFGWIFIPGRGSKTVTTTYYLSTVIDGAKLSTCCVCAELYTTVSGDHDFGCWIDCKDGKQHMHGCKNCGKVETEAHEYDNETHKCVCGAVDPAHNGVKISVDVKEKTTKQYVGWWPWGSYKNVTTYTATIKTEATGVRVTKVQYQLNGGRWTTGTCVSSDKPINTLEVKVTDSTGKVHEYTYPKTND